MLLPRNSSKASLYSNVNTSALNDIAVIVETVFTVAQKQLKGITLQQYDHLSPENVAVIVKTPSAVSQEEFKGMM